MDRREFMERNMIGATALFAVTLRGRTFVRTGKNGPVGTRQPRLVWQSYLRFLDSQPVGGSGDAAHNTRLLRDGLPTVPRAKPFY